MNTLELIDRLCAVTAAQADIIREQAIFIENCKTIDEEVKKQFADHSNQGTHRSEGIFVRITGAAHFNELVCFLH